MDKLPSLFLLVFVALVGLTGGVDVLPDDLVNRAVGETVKFNTTLTSSSENPIGAISWKFDETVVFTAGLTNFTGAGYEDRITVFISTGSLELRNLLPSDSGVYSVRISIKGIEYEDTATLNVFEKISGASVKPSTNQTNEGKPVNLTCEAAGSVSTRKWMKDGLDLTLADHMQYYEEKRVLSFQPLKKTDKEEYSCEISNPVSSMTAKYSLVVNYGPEKVHINGETKVKVGDKITLTCSAESEPSARYIWSVNGTKIHDAPVYSKEKAEVSDSGNYICEARNDVTERSLSAVHELTVTDETGGGLSAGAIAGIVIACLVIIGAAAGVGYYFYRKKKSPGNSSTSRVGGGGQDNSTFSGNKELNYADITAFHSKDGGRVQMRPQNETSEYSQVRGSNNTPAALPTYNAHMQRASRQAPQPAHDETPYAQVRKN